MLRPYSLLLVASLTLVVLLLASCGDTADDSPDTTIAPTTTTTAAPAATTTAPTTTTAATNTTAAPASGPFRLTFDGEKCTYEGPTELKAGPVAIDFVNEMEEPAEEAWRLAFMVNLQRHKGDETVQDMVDYLGPDPSTKHQPLWVSNPQPAPWDSPVLPGQTVNWEGNLEPGTYTMICALLGPFGVWFGTGLTVED